MKNEYKPELFPMRCGRKQIEDMAIEVIKSAFLELKKRHEPVNKFFNINNKDFIFWCRIVNADPGVIIRRIKNNY